jgi:FrmR/RcnR family transcriptional regulator, repressor of frmRAB operon
MRNAEKDGMGHIEKEKAKLLNRLKRIRGQVEGIERAIAEDKDCVRILQQATSCRGALEGFIAEVIEDHIREHLMEPGAPADDVRAQAAEELVEIVHAYLK